VTTVAELAKELKERFGVKECLLVFDRGMMSAENLQVLSEQDFTYISALDRDDKNTGPAGI
jgi:transposase